MTRLIRFTREITIEYHTLSFEPEDVPESLRFLFDGEASEDHELTLADLTPEQHDELDDFLGSAEWTLGETIDTTDRRMIRTDL